MKRVMMLACLMVSTFCYLYALDLDGDSHKGMTKLVIRFENVVGEKPLRLKTEHYTNGSGERFTINTLNYFISNIRLGNKNGSAYIVPQEKSYFLVKEEDTASQSIALYVPQGQYTSITFTIGVDSLRSTMDLSQRTGVLDPSGGMIDGMYWTWNSGYIFFKMEGECDQAATDRTGQKKFRCHIGGFGGYNKPSLNNIRMVTIDLKKKGQIKAAGSGTCTVRLQADVLKVFDAQSEISIAAQAQIMLGNQSKLVAENYSRMFTHIATAY